MGFWGHSFFIYFFLGIITLELGLGGFFFRLFFNWDSNNFMYPISSLYFLSSGAHGQKDLFADVLKRPYSFPWNTTQTTKQLVRPFLENTEDVDENIC